MEKSYIGDIPNTHIRDFQRKRLYQAEERCGFWNTLDVLSIEEIEELVIRISSWAETPVPKLIADGHNFVYATKNCIVLPYPITKTLPYILHEMSHVINYNSDNADHHGKYFASTYLQVVKEFAGPRAYIELKRSFKNLNVKHLTTEKAHSII